MQIPRLTLWYLLAAVGLVVSPHLWRLPVSISLLILACIAWRVLIYTGRAGFPSQLSKLFIVSLGLALTLMHYRGQGAGLDIAVCLLIVGAVFKLLEMREHRDMIIVICLCYVLVMAGFIYSQTILAALLALTSFVVITGALLSLQRGKELTSFGDNSRLALRMVAQSIPLGIALFILVPRVAPLWSMPIPVSSNKTGVSDEMSPGDISNLSRSAELAFRVSFADGTPSHEQLYWRGLVLDYFDGRTWRRAASSVQSPDMIRRYRDFSRGEYLGEALDYDVILEPTQQRWIYALQLAQFTASDIVQDAYYTLHKDKPLAQRYRYQMRSYLDNRTDRELPNVLLARATQLPEQDSNTQALALARRLRAAATDELAYANSVLRYFREQAFYYTLTPPPLGQSPIDEFLFTSLQGFCEHYAGSFVYLMRAAGIPARVVVGYQGGEQNPFESYTMVYQYNAHAWAEVWLQGRGWVRFDPTAAVAPERISLGAQAVLADQPGFMADGRFSMMRFRNHQWLNSLRLRLDAMDYAWNRWVISYDEDLQLQFLEGLFGEGARENLYIALGGAISLFFALAALVLLRGGGRSGHDLATRHYLRLTADLAQLGLRRQAGEGPVDYGSRVATLRPDLAEDMQSITRLYIALSYALEGESDGEGKEQRIAVLLRQIKGLRLRLLAPLQRAVLRLTPQRFQA